MIIPDTPDKYKSNNQDITNYDHRYRGLISVRDSLASSRNVPAVRAFRMVPSEQSKETFDKLASAISKTLFLNRHH